MARKCPKALFLPFFCNFPRARRENGKTRALAAPDFRPHRRGGGERPRQGSLLRRDGGFAIIAPIMTLLTKWLTSHHWNHTCEEIPMDAKALATRAIIYIQRLLYKTGTKASGAYALAPPALPLDDAISLIAGKIRAGAPFLAGKIGTGDGETLLRHIDIEAKESAFAKTLKLLAGKRGPFWWDNSIRAGLCICADVFPTDIASIEEFCTIFMDYAKDFDAFARCTYGERRLYDLLCPHAASIPMDALVPLNHGQTWYGALEGKRVLVVHQYEKTIKAQYAKRAEFHRGQGKLPDFELLTYRPVNSIGGKCRQFARWKDALQHMMDDVSRLEFDVALLGCGVYGIPLSAHIKRMGKPAIYTGGATQAIFGIKGKRWDGAGIYNENWVRPFQDDIPENMGMIEGGCFL